MAQGESGDRVSSHRVTGPGNPITRSQITRSSSRLLKNGCGCRGWPFATRDAGDSLRQGCFSLEWHREQKASHRKRLRRRGAVCGVGAPPRCAPASPSSRLLASDPAALATPPTPFFSSLLEVFLEELRQGGVAEVQGVSSAEAVLLAGLDLELVRPAGLCQSVHEGERVLQM